MFTPLDNLLYPRDRCSVYEYKPGRYVYTIYKNASSSIEKSGYRRLSLDEIKTLDNIDVFVREPTDRYVSGLQKYLRDTGKDKDRSTAISFAKEILFYNSHFSPQMFWMFNLTRFVKHDINVSIHDVSELYSITSARRQVADRQKSLTNEFIEYDRLNYYLLMDLVLTGLVGHTVTLSDIFKKFKEDYPELYNDVIVSSKEVANALP